MNGQITCRTTRRALSCMALKLTVKMITSLTLKLENFPTMHVRSTERRLSQKSDSKLTKGTFPLEAKKLDTLKTTARKKTGKSSMDANKCLTILGQALQCCSTYDAKGCKKQRNKLAQKLSTTFHRLNERLFAVQDKLFKEE
ncbi:hypothetical protein M514_14466 [Trichuris suis]|uniref:Uncharacterized protein n=1 Tax=Trichuris suis TaxID=68888 RepID=A0A085NUI0_9BILA|nr:hypothetical protein M514_14466 [Trichuris suis]